MGALQRSVQYLKGVGEDRARGFAKLGIRTFYDLVRNFPRDYEDRTVFKTISELAHGETVSVVAVVGAAPRLSRISGGRKLVTLRVFDDGGTLELSFFNTAYVKDQLLPGEKYLFYGKAQRFGNAVSMTNPVFERVPAGGEVTGSIVPVYALTAGINRRTMSNSVTVALSECRDELPDALPRSVRERYGLAAARFAYWNIHFPKDFESLRIARRRFIFEELFVIAALSRLRRDARDGVAGRVFAPPDFDAFYESLPFSPTSAQKRAIAEASGDCASGRVMNRLVQGDVGSGKTLVAMALCFGAAKSGFQSAFMAPTELLAEQHFRTFCGILEPLGVRVGLLTGGMGAAAKREAREALALGQLDVIVGTHALISEGLEYRDLALVVTDEQHRFGVNQRARLGRKGESPHVLVMSATPIPRTLALILYGDLDVSVIDELPPGRQKVLTYSVGEKMRDRIYEFAKKLVAEGRQVYFVCPAVEESEAWDSGDLKRAREYAKQLQTDVFPELRVGLVHGSMKSKEKDGAMAKFLSGETQILVATTVIEVGVDVANAALMVIENADRFGLSQLHQLRGRVGRGAHRSYCVMFEGAGGEKSRERLQTLCGTNDGFAIAEADLLQRGPGDFFGSRQHGIPASRFYEMAAEGDVILDARQAVDEVLSADPTLDDPENAPLRGRVDAVFSDAEGTIN